MSFSILSFLDSSLDKIFDVLLDIPSMKLDATFALVLVIELKKKQKLKQKSLI